MLRFGGKIGKGEREKVVQTESQEQRTAADIVGCERVGQTRPKTEKCGRLSVQSDIPVRTS